MLTVQSYETHAPNRLSELLFFNDTATTEIYTLSLHDALPILCPADRPPPDEVGAVDGDDRVYPAAHVPLVVETRAGLGGLPCCRHGRSRCFSLPESAGPQSSAHCAARDSRRPARSPRRSDCRLRTRRRFGCTSPR